MRGHDEMTLFMSVSLSVFAGEMRPQCVIDRFPTDLA